MEVSYGEGLATHTGPESCAVDREVGGEALTGECAGRVLSREISGYQLRGADAVDTCGRSHPLRHQLGDAVLAEHDDRSDEQHVGPADQVLDRIKSLEV